MKALLAIALFAIAMPVFAKTNSITLVFSEDLKDPDKTIAKIDSKTLFQDEIEVPWAKMARYQSVTNSAIRFRLADYAVDVGTVKKNITKEDAEKDIKDKLSEKSKCIVVACGWI